MMKDKKVVIITGSQSGIGAAIAHRFSEGPYVVVTNSRKKPLGENAFMGDLYVSADVSSKSGVSTLFDQVYAKYGRIDILVNNAGGTSEPEFRDSHDGELEKYMAQNFFSAYYCCQEFVKLMKSGCIVNISSTCGCSTKCEDLPIYSSAKAALRNFGQNLAKILAPKIRVNTILPGFVKTPAWGDLTKDQESYYSNKQLIKRFIRPDEIADAVWFLTHNEAMSGAEIVIDGGLTIA